ncbi:formamidopyrimidine-DNA glycosylase [Pendulispora rubella]|uniref:Formamidopyrimidine-DNA glycosylase n=1 Tax=Pendulispora rubella TaxID=2741070 RepID=A0ABZ2LBU3_9BACT
MPELPDVTLYIEAIAARVVGQPLRKIRLASPFVLRTVVPAPARFEGHPVTDVRRVGKRIVLGLRDGDTRLFAVIHLMIAGRFRFLPPAAKIPGKVGLAAFDFPNGTLVLTEVSKKKRASIHLVEGEAALRALDPGGLEVLTADLAAFRQALTRENHTLKRSLTDPHLFSGIGNAYSDEILHRAGLSPVRLTAHLTDEEIARLFEATTATLVDWTNRLRDEAAGKFPEKVTAFRPEMAVHGRYGQPCPVCGGRVQRIVYAENETNYCPRCQTGGKLLMDRSLSRLLKDDWPKTIDELEQRRADASASGSRSVAAASSAPDAKPKRRASPRRP